MEFLEILHYCAFDRQAAKTVAISLVLTLSFCVKMKSQITAKYFTKMVDISNGL